jgi:hypothetical protein
VSQFAQTNTGDWDLSSGNLQVSTDLAQNTAWELSNLFSFFKGEWFRDTRQGLPYVQFVLVANPNLDLISSIFAKTLKTPQGVASVDQLDVTFFRSTRQLQVTCKVRTNSGAIITGGVGQPFIIDVAAAAPAGAGGAQ